MTFDAGLLEKQAEEFSKKGLQDYSSWWHSNSVTNEERKYLVDNGFHETFKEIANNVK